MYKSKIEQIPVSQLLVDPVVQRGLDLFRANKIADEFNEAALGIVTVSLRSDGYRYVVDGQHRRAGSELARGPEYKVPCRVFTGLSIPDEAALWRLLNNTKKPSLIDGFRLRMIEGDPTAVAIGDILEVNGWKIGTTNKGFFAAVSAAEQLYRISPTATEDAIETITNAWGHDASSVEGNILKGVGQVYIRHGDVIDRADLTMRLAKTYKQGADTFLGKARGLKVSLGGSLSGAVAELTVEAYNKGRRGRASALPAWRK